MILQILKESSDQRDDHGELVEQDESPCSRVRVDERNLPAESLGDVQERDGLAELPDVQLRDLLERRQVNAGGGETDEILLGREQRDRSEHGGHDRDQHRKPREWPEYPG